MKVTVGRLRAMIREAIDPAGDAPETKKNTKKLAVPSIDQTTGMCGPASLRAILKFYGVDKTEKELQALTGATKNDGVKPEGIVKAAQALGFKAFTKDGANMKDLKQWLAKGVPVIVDWFSENEGHYSVVKTIKDDTVKLMDPELGKEREMSVKEFMNVWFDFEDDTETHQGFVQRQIVVVYPG